MANSSKVYWDKMARENAAWYSANRFTSESRAFFESGARDTDSILGLLGVHINESSVVLEIGCGAGRMTKRLVQRAGRVIATDLSPEMLRRAESNLEGTQNVEFLELEGDGTLPVDSASIDIVFSYITMQHVADPQAQARYFAEALRSIRPGGWVVIQYRRTSLTRQIRALAANIFHLLAGRKTMSKWWRGNAVDGALLRQYRSAEITVDALTLDDGHIWAVARRRKSPVRTGKS